MTPTSVNIEQIEPLEHLRKYLPKSRFNASIGHLVISIAIFLLLAIIIYWCWYPGALFLAAGGVDGIKIIAGVDLVLGPLLTLIIFNPAKKIRLIIFDLIVIVLIQFSCLLIGVYIVYNERPVAISYLYDRFYAIKKKDFQGDQTKNEIVKQFNSMSPQFYYLELPEDDAEIRAALAVHSMLGSDMKTDTDLYLSMPIQRNKALMALRKSEADTDCLEVQITSAYAEGIACYDIENQKLYNFQEQELVKF